MHVWPSNLDDGIMNLVVYWNDPSSVCLEMVEYSSEWKSSLYFQFNIYGWGSAKDLKVTQFLLLHCVLREGFLYETLALPDGFGVHQGLVLLWISGESSFSFSFDVMEDWHKRFSLKIEPTHQGYGKFWIHGLKHNVLPIMETDTAGQY